MTRKINWSLVTAASLPILMIIAVTLSIYVPTRFQKFHGQFLYAIQENGSSGYNSSFAVVNGKLIERPLTLPLYRTAVATEPVHVYLHDLEKNESRDLSLEEAQRLTLDNSQRSSDGLQIEYGSQGDAFFPLFFFAHADYSAVYIKGARGSRKLNVRIKPDSYYYNQFQFIGWVKS